MRDKIIEKIEVLRKTILNDKNVNVLDKGLYCFELCEIRLEIEEQELKSDLLNPVIKSQIFLVNYYCNGAQSIEGAFSSQDLADKWISKQTDNIPYCTLVSPIDFL